MNKTVYPIDFKRFRQNMKVVVNARGLTSEKLSFSTNIASARISDVMNDEPPTIQEVCALCMALGYSIDDMLYKDARLTIEFVYNIIRPR